MKYSIIFLAISAFYIAGCKHAEHTKQEESEFIVSSPIKVDTSINKEYVCQIRASNHIELRSLERGYLTKILLKYSTNPFLMQKMFH
jgi:membrane fusion protein (multidrug efflux system)